jgi:hypothetical protein
MSVISAHELVIIRVELSRLIAADSPLLDKRAVLRREKVAAIQHFIDNCSTWHRVLFEAMPALEALTNLALLSPGDSFFTGAPFFTVKEIEVFEVGLAGA